jgi:hypothetical protein
MYTAVPGTRSFTPGFNTTVTASRVGRNTNRIEASLGEM